MRKNVLMFAVLACAACSGKSGSAGRGGGGGAAIDAGPPDKPARCQQFWDRTLGALQVAVRGMGGDAELSAGDRAELAGIEREWMTQCLAFPDDVFACLEPGADESAPRCRRAAAAIEGVVELDPQAPDGPPIIWTARVDEARPLEPLPVIARADGTVIVASRGDVAALGESGTLWSVPIDHDGWLHATAELVLTSDGARHEIVALWAATGKQAWRVALPRDAAAEADADDGRGVEAVALDGDGVWLGLADGRLLHITPASCPRKPGCLTPGPRLASEEFDDAELVAVRPGRFLLLAIGGFRDLSGTPGTPLEVGFDLRARDVTGGVALGRGGLAALVIDGEVVLLDLARCGRAAPPSRLEARRGTIEIEPCDECAPPPPGCVTARARTGDADNVAPIWTSRGVVLAADGKLQLASHDGKVLWRADVGAAGRVRADKGRVYVLSFAGDEGERLRVVAVELASGKLLWQRDLGVTVPGMLVSLDDLTLEHAGKALVAGYKRDLVVLRLRDE